MKNNQFKNLYYMLVFTFIVSVCAFAQGPPPPPDGGGGPGVQIDVPIAQWVWVSLLLGAVFGIKKMK